jgi:hypothetical protein
MINLLDKEILFRDTDQAEWNTAPSPPPLKPSEEWFLSSLPTEKEIEKEFPFGKTFIVPMEFFLAHPERKDLVVLPTDSEKDEKGRFFFVLGRRGGIAQRLFFTTTRKWEGFQDKVFTMEALISVKQFVG